MDKKYILFVISIISIISSFFVGLFFEKDKHVKQINDIINKKYIIQMKTTKTKLEIDNSYSNIEIILNWKSLNWSWVVLDLVSKK